MNSRELFLSFYKIFRDPQNFWLFPGENFKKSWGAVYWFSHLQRGYVVKEVIWTLNVSCKKEMVVRLPATWWHSQRSCMNVEYQLQEGNGCKLLLYVSHWTSCTHTRVLRGMRVRSYLVSGTTSLFGCTGGSTPLCAPVRGKKIQKLGWQIVFWQKAGVLILILLTSVTDSYLQDHMRSHEKVWPILAKNTFSDQLTYSPIYLAA